MKLERQCSPIGRNKSSKTEFLTLARAEEKILELEWRVEEATECRCRREERNRVNPVDVGTVEGSNFGDDEYFSPPRTFGVEEPSEEWVMVEEE